MCSAKSLLKNPFITSPPPPTIPLLSLNVVDWYADMTIWRMSQVKEKRFFTSLLTWILSQLTGLHSDVFLCNCYYSCPCLSKDASLVCVCPSSPDHSHKVKETTQTQWFGLPKRLVWESNVFPLLERAKQDSSSRVFTSRIAKSSGELNLLSPKPCIKKKESQRHALFSFCSTITVTTTCTNVQLTQTHTYMLSGHKSKSGSPSSSFLFISTLSLFLIFLISTLRFILRLLIYMHSFTPSLSTFLLTFIRLISIRRRDHQTFSEYKESKRSLSSLLLYHQKEQFKFKAQRSERDDGEASSNHVKSERERNLPFTDLI